MDSLAIRFRIYSIMEDHLNRTWFWKDYNEISYQTARLVYANIWENLSDSNQPDFRSIQNVIRISNESHK